MPDSFVVNKFIMNNTLLSTLENSGKYTLSVAEAMPDNLYKTKPTDAVWNFGELLHHIAYGIGWWKDNYIKGISTEWNPPVVKEDKKQIITYLKKEYNDLQTAISNGKLTEDAVKGFHATIDHITHHRGQAVLHLRCQGITPPDYLY
jgi:uncharacterized damage-inducible protein DinB